MAEDGAAVGDWEPRSDGRAVNITVGEREGIFEGDIDGGDEMGISVGVTVDSVEGSGEGIAVFEGLTVGTVDTVGLRVVEGLAVEVG